MYLKGYKDLNGFNKAFGALTGRLVHPTAPVLLTKSGPLGARIRHPAPELDGA